MKSSSLCLSQTHLFKMNEGVTTVGEAALTDLSIGGAPRLEVWRTVSWSVSSCPADDVLMTVLENWEN